MRISWSANQHTLSRARIAAAVVFIVLAVSWTPANDLTLVELERRYNIKKDTKRCTKLHDGCTPTSCEDSTYNGFGVCREGRDGPGSAITIQCCCCTDGFENRYWIGG